MRSDARRDRTEEELLVTVARRVVDTVRAAAPYRYRARAVAALTAGVLLGGLASTHGSLAPLFAGAVALVASVLALVLRAVLWPRATTARLPQVQARTLRSVGRVLRATWSDGSPRRVADERRLLQSDLVTVRLVHTDALADDRSATPNTDLRWPVTVGIEELAFLALSYPRDRPTPEAGLTRRVLDRLEELSVAVDGDGPAPEVGDLYVPGYPRTSGALISLGIAVAAVISESTPHVRAVPTTG